MAKNASISAERCLLCGGPLGAMARRQPVLSQTEFSSWHINFPDSPGLGARGCSGGRDVCLGHTFDALRPNGPIAPTGYAVLDHGTHPQR